MKRLRNSAPFSMVFCFLLSIFIVLGAYNAFAAPEPLPFNFFVPALGSLQWQSISDTRSCYDNVPNEVLNISDARDASNKGDAYDGAWMTAVGTTNVRPIGTGDLTGNTYTAVPQNISGLSVTYQLYFSADTQCNRFILFFDNTTGGPINETVRIATNFGSDSSTQIEGTSSGDLTFTTADRWLVTSDVEPFSDPVLTNVFYGPGNPAVTPTSVTQQECDGSSSPPQGAEVVFDITVPGGETRCLMHFGCLADITGLENTVEGALAAAPLFDSNNTIPGDLLSGLSPLELSECLNWDFPKPEPIPTLSEWGLIAMAGILGIVGFMVLRKRKATA